MFSAPRHVVVVVVVVVVVESAARYGQNQQIY
jgi:hypothetical protein